MWRKTKKIEVFGAAFVLLFTMVSAVFGMNINSDTRNFAIEKNDLLCDVRNIDESTIEVVVNSPSFEFSSVDTTEGKFATIELSNEGFTTIAGEAKLPTLRRMVEIPQGSNPEIEVRSVSWQCTSLGELGLPMRVLPVQPSVPKIPEFTQDFVIDNNYYFQDAFVSTDVAKIVDTGDFRGHRFALVEISPVQYNPSLGELKLMTACSLQINLPGSDMTQTLAKIQRYTTPSFEKTFETTFANYGFYENIANAPKDQEGYLIIVYDSFYDAIQPLASWKVGKGFEVTVTKTSEIPSGPTKENIHAYIDDAYNNWPIPPAYVLLVGDVAQIPTWTGTETGTCTDLYYVTITSGDYFADIIISRFPAATPEQVTIMVDKTIYYETGSFPDSSWIKKAAFMASNDNYQVSEGTHNYVIDTYLTPNGYTCDKLYCHTYSATTQQVKNALNNGRSLAIYSGHGGTDYWADGPVFYQSDVNSLTNDGMYPFVCSHACLTNQFTVSECFGETWLRAPNKGGLAFWGATTYSYWDEDDILERSMFDAWWNDSIETIGGMTNMGLYYLYQYYGGGGMSKYYFEEYNVLGDSSVKIWRNNPSNPPETPDKPTGPTNGIWFVEYSFSSKTTEPDGDQIFYMFSWGDGTYSEWLGPFTSGQIVTASHIWTEIGTYEVKVTAKDVYGAQSSWSDPLVVIITDNTPPNTPTITGKTNIKPLKQYLYIINATDPENQDVKYDIDWGDGNGASGLGPYLSGAEIPMKHAWTLKGTYTIKVRAVDTVGGQSDWATLDITVALSRNRGPVNPFFLGFLERFPNAFPMLRHLLGL